MEEFTPPIKERNTDELLEIVAFEKDWNPKAVLLAKNELNNRNVASQKVENAKSKAKEYKQVRQLEKAHEGFTIADFIFHFGPTLFIILFSWELKKDGFTKKAKQQKYFRMFLGGIIFCYVVFFILS